MKPFSLHTLQKPQGAMRWKVIFDPSMYTLIPSRSCTSCSSSSHPQKSQLRWWPQSGPISITTWQLSSQGRCHSLLVHSHLPPVWVILWNPNFLASKGSALRERRRVSLLTVNTDPQWPLLFSDLASGPVFCSFKNIGGWLCSLCRLWQGFHDIYICQNIKLYTWTMCSSLSTVPQ